jgi:putative nucleotidyltransferase with HDIG domain
MRELPWAARVYVAIVCSAAVVAAGRVFLGPVNEVALAATSVLYVVVESLTTVRVGRTVLVSASFPVLVAAVILLGPWGAAFVGLTTVLSRQPADLPLVKRVFNGAQMSLYGMAGGLVYELLGGDRVLGSDDFPKALLVVLVTAGVMSVANTCLVGGIVCLAQRVPLLVALRGGATPMLAHLGYGVFGLMMAVLWGTELGVFATVLVLLPLLVARWAFAQYAEQRQAYERTVRTLVQAVETKDYYTRGHSERVSRGSEMIARELGMREDRVQLLRFAGILHDLGKLGVPTRLLQKSGPLTGDEFEAIKLHPLRGVEMVREIDFLREAYDGIRHHHERLDGRGYPDGLTGEQIPEFARVIAVADAFDSMTSTRSYRSARSVDEAIAELVRSRGTHLDPVMVDALVQAVAEQGWTPSEVPALPPGVPIEVTRYDHDDPALATPLPRDDPS